MQLPAAFGLYFSTQSKDWTVPLKHCLLYGAVWRLIVPWGAQVNNVFQKGTSSCLTWLQTGQWRARSGAIAPSTLHPLSIMVAMPTAPTGRGFDSWMPSNRPSKGYEGFFFSASLPYAAVWGNHNLIWHEAAGKFYWESWVTKKFLTETFSHWEK